MSDLKHATPFDVHLQWFAGPEGEPVDEGQSSEIPVESGQDLFHAWTEPGGETKNFATADELNNYLKENYLRRQDYTQKTQNISEMRKGLDAERLKLENDRKEWQSQYSKQQERDKDIMAMHNFLLNHPQVETQLRELMNQGPSEKDLEKQFDEMFEKKYGSKLQELESWKMQQELERQREEAHTKLQSQYPDYNKDAVTQAFQELGAGNDIGALFEILHLSLLGKKSPEEIEQKLIQDQVVKKDAGLLKGSGKQTKSSNNNEFSTIEDAAAAARKYGW
jgi:hypothetical protein